MITRRPLQVASCASRAIMSRKLWGVVGLLLAAGAGFGYFHVLWHVYGNQTLEYANATYTVSTFESVFLYWFSGLGLLVTVGLTLGLTLLLPEIKWRIPDWSLALIPVAVLAAIAIPWLVFRGAP